jgi:hypothetical protein
MILGVLLKYSVIIPGKAYSNLHNFFGTNLGISTLYKIFLENFFLYFL